LLTAKRYRRELNAIFADSDQFNRHLQLALSGKSRVVSRFFNTTVFNITRFMEDTRDKVDHWSRHVLHPLSQQLKDQKATLDSYQNDLQQLKKTGSNASGQLKALETLLTDLDIEIEQCQATLELLERFKPEDEKSNIVQFQQRKFGF
jgi:septal ring factor EnvC (AmiA/AmiB activator)